MTSRNLQYFSKQGDPGFACKCGKCGLGFDDMDMTTLRMLDAARNIADVAFHINSGIRCPAHNQTVSGSGPDGPHTTGKSVDVRATDSRTRYKILEAAILMGFNRIGIHRRFIHLDNDETKDPEVVWLYD